jgi:putative tricarboxylic transport membrane protein
MSKERTASLIFLAFGLYGIILSLQLPLGNLREPGPAMLPISLSILLCVSGGLWLIYGKKKQEAGKIVWSALVKRLITPGKILLATAGFVFIFERAGYLVTSFLYVFVLFFWISRFRFLIALGLALLIGAGSWYFFGRVLGVPLPQGIFDYL